MLFILVIYCAVFVHALKLPRPPMKVKTYVSPYAESSDDWLTVIEKLEDDFPEVVFETVNVRPDDLDPGKPIAVPYSSLNEGNKDYVLNYPMTYAFAKRWISDAAQGFFELFRNTSIMQKSKSAVYVHILSPTKPGIPFVHRFPEIVFSWTKMGYKTRNNTVIVRGMDGVLRQHSDFVFSNLLHSLLPPVIPNWMLDTELGMKIFKKFALREVTIICDESLDPGWHSLIQEFPKTAFIQMRSNETNVTTVPSVWFMRRSVQFMLPSVGADVVPWLHGIRRHTTVPWYRASAAPAVPHETVDDVTGDSFWSWIRKHEQAVLYLYDTNDPQDFSETAEVLRSQNIGMGRMDLRLNDHEHLPLGAQAGYCLHFRHEYLVDMQSCGTFVMPFKDTPKMEL